MSEINTFNLIEDDGKEYIILGSKKWNKDKFYKYIENRGAKICKATETFYQIVQDGECIGNIQLPVKKKYDTTINPTHELYQNGTMGIKYWSWVCESLGIDPYTFNKDEIKMAWEKWLGVEKKLKAAPVSF